MKHRIEDNRIDMNGSTEDSPDTTDTGTAGNDPNTAQDAEGGAVQEIDIAVPDHRKDPPDRGGRPSGQEGNDQGSAYVGLDPSDRRQAAYFADQWGCTLDKARKGMRTLMERQNFSEVNMEKGDIR